MQLLEWQCCTKISVNPGMDCFDEDGQVSFERQQSNIVSHSTTHLIICFTIDIFIDKIDFVIFKIEVQIEMEKIELLSRIRKLSSVVHGCDLAEYKLADESIVEMRRILDELSEKYIKAYCQS